ncbi:MAG: Ig-like domain-containing protein [Sandaracinaceae bacterium]
MLDGTASGGAGELRLHEGDPGARRDVPDSDPGPVAETYDVDTHVRVTEQDGAFYVQVAVPFADLATEGVGPGDLVIWAGTSSDGEVLDLDMACHNRLLSTPSLPYIPIYPVVIGAYVAIDSPMDGATLDDPTPVIRGRGDAGATVEVRIGGTLVGTATVAADGTWSVTVTPGLADGDYTVEVELSDPDGNTADASVDITVSGGAIPADSDADGVPDSVERPGGVDRDTDMDGEPDHMDGDDDGDGVGTKDEVTADGGLIDTDMDGTPDYRDDDDDDDGLSTRSEWPMNTDVDTDMDGTPDYRDDDDDNDGILTATELADAARHGEPDADGVPAYLDLDSDGDGDSDEDEGTEDADSDGVPNYLDEDDDMPRPDGGTPDGGTADGGMTGTDGGTASDAGPPPPLRLPWHRATRGARCAQHPPSARAGPGRSSSW